jgi:hypothetical protein
MPQPLPDRPDFFTRHRALPEQAVAATVARGRGAPCPASPGKPAYGEDAVGHTTGRPFVMAALDAGAELSQSLTGGVFVGPAFVTGRLATPRSRRPVLHEEPAHV